MHIQLNHDVEVFIASLEKPTIAKVLRTIDLLERFGHQLGMPHSKRVNRDLHELRIRGQQEVRIFYTLKRGSAYLLHGFIKKSPRIPLREIEQAERKMRGLT
ncbi:hypothetical protein A2753_02015 [Candidatus Uhrbacteria bacterium RIFCSPHIGHO2_01_FULL_47_11]|nr:MAG: hypothetical protein A2753_02015 [Candidatus Uhrbacteria bacterium RIFCSPHIGHO2_01_FULL_47_11]